MASGGNVSHVFLTGGSGFVGQAVQDRLRRDSNHRLTLALRSTRGASPERVVVFPFSNLDANENWRAGLTDVDVVIHSAARVHVMSDAASDPLVEYRKTNVEGTLNLARQAAAAGVKRFVFVSSIKVNGEETAFGQPFTAADTPAPVDPYAISKLEAEQGLRMLAQKTGIEVVIIRPVLVYGPGVKANFRNMMQWLRKGVPLPLGAIRNKRSLVALDNLVDLIVTCIDHLRAANQTFLVSDGEDLSTTELLSKLGLALGRPARLLPVPQKLITTGAVLAGKGDVARRLCGSLQVDISKTREVLGWAPPISVDEAVARAARDFLAQTGK